MSFNFIHPSLYDFRDAFEHLGGVAAISADGNFIAVSEGFTDLFGYSDGDVVGKSILMMNQADGMPGFYNSMWQSISSGKKWTGELLCQAKDGESIWTRLTIAPSWRDSEVHGFIALYQRVYVKAHNQLSDIFYRYRAGFNKVLALAIVSKEGIVQEVNDLFTQLYGYERAEIIGKPISTLKSGTTKSDTYAALWETVLGEKMWSHEIDNQRKDGSIVHVRATIAPATEADRDGGIHDAFLVIYQDIGSEITEREIRIQLAVEASRQEMMSGTLHNIGNLQQSVSTANEQSLMLTESLRNACLSAKDHLGNIDNDEGKEVFFAAAMDICVTTSQQILDALLVERSAIHETNLVLQYFRNQQRNITLSDEVNIPDFVQNILSTFVLQADRHGISVSISKMTENECARWPIEKVQQILFNLLKNAKEAVFAWREKGRNNGKYHGHISLSIEDEGSYVLFRVKDNGGGFNVEESTLFSQGFTTKNNGTGIGLHYAAIMAQSMQGSLSAENVEFEGNRGARFTLRVPRFQENSVVNKSRFS